MKTEKVVLACGGSGCCPEVHFNDDGTVDLIDTDDGRNEHIRLSADQASILRNAMNERASK